MQQLPNFDEDRQLIYMELVRLLNSTSFLAGVILPDTYDEARKKEFIEAKKAVCIELGDIAYKLTKKQQETFKDTSFADLDRAFEAGEDVTDYFKIEVDPVTHKPKP